MRAADHGEPGTARERKTPLRSHAGLWGNLLLLLLLNACAIAAWGSGPRYVTGWPFFTASPGLAVAWSNTSPRYYTDPGSLSVFVSHEAADALVAGAAAVWNVPVASLMMARGGSLDEHVSGANVYLGSNGLVYPTDVASTNSAAKPIVVIYDADGSVTDTLLGNGASDPSSCRQNAVTESVDQFDPAGYILHAVLVLNGRCTGPAPEQQLQLQYQLMRAFGRVLGLAWSQTNDNVYTGTPLPTIQQALNWPIMHPLDILCGNYSYQCLPQPFTLRPDDIASLATLYPVTQNPPPAGKQVTLAQAGQAQGWLLFPTGEGMGGVNVVLRRINTNETVVEGWETASAVSGTYFRRMQATPITAQGTAVNDSAGTFTRDAQGGYFVGYMPVQTGSNRYTLVTSTQAVNPLYTGDYAVGPYISSTVAPSGSAASINVLGSFVGSVSRLSIPIPDAASLCSSGADGTAAAPLPADASGWWNGLLCAYGHFAWTSLSVRAGRSFTLEVTALDEQGYATTTKALPVMGAWAATDATNSLNTLAAASSPLNALTLGTTTMLVTVTQATPVRLAIADQRGDGRPDFGFQARLLYADTISPANVPLAGGPVTITGMGFRAGNAVRINGVLATDVTWTSSSITLTVPSLVDAGATSGTAVDVVVSDLSTGATSTMTGALTYTDPAALPNVMLLLAAPSATSQVGDVTSIPFSVQVLKSDGVTPVAGEAVTFSGTVGGNANNLKYGACGAAVCVSTTDARGVASTTLTPLAAGSVVLKAVDKTLSVSSTFTVIAKAGSMLLATAPSGAVYVGSSAPALFSVQILAADGKTFVAGRQVTFSTTAGSATFDACVASTCVVTTNSSGIASTGVTPRAAGPITVQAADGALTQTATFTGLDSTPVLRIIGSSPGSGYIQSRTSAAFTVGLYKADGVTPLAQQAITFSANASTAGGPTGLTFTLCGTNPCTALTSGLGTVGGPLDLGGQPGTYTLRAAYGAVVQTIVVTVLPKTLNFRIVSAPSGKQQVGKVSPTLFTVRVLAFDGVSPLQAFVTLSGVPGAVLLGGCPFPSCRWLTDANGYVSTTVTPLVLGPITVQALMNDLSLTAEMTGVSSSDTMQIVSLPTGTNYVSQIASVPFAVQVIGAGQTTPTPGIPVTLSVVGGSATYSACGRATCTLITDANGIASSSLTPISSGTVSLLASDGLVTQRTSFIVSPPIQNVLRLVSAPNGSVPAGDVTVVPFAVRLISSDGITPAAGRSVALSVPIGSATFTACGASNCVLVTDAGGNVSSTIKPVAGGAIMVRAVVGSLSQTATFMAVANPELLRLVSAPTGSVYVGEAAAPAFAVQVLTSGGVTSVPSRIVTFAVTSGLARLSACTSATCTVTSNAAGVASITVTPLAAGPVSLQATVGTAVQTMSVLGVANITTLALSPSTLFVAEASTVQWSFTAAATFNGVNAVSVAVTWNSSAGLALAGSQSLTDSSGNTQMNARIGPLAAGASAGATACAWITVCAGFSAVPVPASAWRVKILGGGAQAVIGGAALQPMVIQITDGLQNPVAGASVLIGQTVTHHPRPCPLTGRCPAAPVLTTLTSAGVTDVAGQITLTPLSANSHPTLTNVAISSGTQGFSSAVLSRTP